MSDAVQRTRFAPQPRDFTGHRLPATVPAGTRLELSRSRIVPGQESVFEDWMRMLTTRYDGEANVAPKSSLAMYRRAHLGSIRDKSCERCQLPNLRC